MFIKYGIWDFDWNYSTFKWPYHGVEYLYVWCLKKDDCLPQVAVLTLWPLFPFGHTEVKWVAWSLVVKSIEVATTSSGPKENCLTARGCPLAVREHLARMSTNWKKLRILNSFHRRCEQGWKFAATSQKGKISAWRLYFCLIHIAGGFLSSTRLFGRWAKVNFHPWKLVIITNS